MMLAVIPYDCHAYENIESEVVMIDLLRFRMNLYASDLTATCREML
ncbi:hypothetical protein KPK_A0017 (plasmid) [Klebsiella variicola]|uniref:Uncharacterized protein n=1 Tax=Klebsiella variicola (strain 342) TaxID=507522 RepID=B5RJU5_KLEV3|nr:hypothetical protein KPK_A0017 [Klebsiella variicola]